jgi:hypothetical protein
MRPVEVLEGIQACGRKPDRLSREQGSLGRRGKGASPTHEVEDLNTIESLREVLRHTGAGLQHLPYQVR